MERRAEALRDEIGVILEGELADPRIGLATVSEVVMNPGGKSARVYVQVEGATEEELEQTLTGLNAAKGYIRSELTAQLGVRHCPELYFAIDRSSASGGRISELLGRVEQRKRKVDDVKIPPVPAKNVGTDGAPADADKEIGSKARDSTGNETKGNG